MLSYLLPRLMLLLCSRLQTTQPKMRFIQLPETVRFSSRSDQRSASVKNNKVQHSGRAPNIGPTSLQIADPAVVQLLRELLVVLHTGLRFLAGKARLQRGCLQVT